MEPARKLATWEDLLALSEDVRAEVIAGAVVTPPSPLPRHARAQGALRRFIGGPYDDDDGRSSLIAKLDAAETAVKTRAKGTVEARNTVKEQLVQALHDIKAYVQSIASANPEQAEEMIASAGLRSRKIPSRIKAELAITPGTTSGAAKLDAKAVARRAAYEWQWSSDGGKTWTSLPPTLQARTTVSGLPVGAACSFRYRGLTRTGEGDWSQVVLYLVK